MLDKKLYICRIIFIGLIFLIVITSCSTQKNTKTTRAYHDLTSHFNVYFNGNESLKAGELRLKKNYKEDYSKIIPVFIYEDKEAAKMLSADMDRAIKKSAKTIKTHSITAKPKIKKKNISREEQAFLAKAEYCKWIDNAYLLMAKAHFYKREYETAKEMLILVINKYKSEDTKYGAMLWLAKTYVELGEFSSATNTLIDLRKAKRNDKKINIEMDLIFASMFMKQLKYQEVAQRLVKVVDKERNKIERMRHLFILAQIYQYNDKYKLSEKYYKSVIKRNPNYDMTFMAKIRLAEIFEKSGGDAQKLKQQLVQMAKDEKNTEYLDQIYYALGKIELNQENPPRAVDYFTKSAQVESSNKVQRIKTYIALAEYYYNKNNLKLSTNYYDSTYNSIQPDFPDYNKIYPEIENHYALTQELSVIVEQDSLQALAKMGESERNNLINSIIQDIVRKEEVAQANKRRNASMGYDPIFDSNYNRPTNPNQGGKYYFYNPSVISLGMTEFKKKWGDRRLSDNWRRSNKQTNASEDNNQNPENTKINNANTEKEEKSVNNIKSREYYLQNIPLTVEKMEASNKKIQDAFFNSAVIYNTKMNDNTNAVKQLETLLQRFTKTEYRKEALYKLYKIHLAEMETVEAERYKGMIIVEYPESVYAKILSNPTYANTLIQSEKEAEKLYKSAVDKFKNNEYLQSIEIANTGIKQYPNSNLIPNFIYIKAISHGELQNKKELRKNLELLIKNHPETDVAKSAQGIIAVLDTKKYDENIYELNKDTIHYYVIIFNKKPKIDMNGLSFKYKSFNVKNYTQEDLKVNQIELYESSNVLVVSDFKSSKEAELYLTQIILSNILNDFKSNISSQFIISNRNYQTFLLNKDLYKYLKFYNSNYITPTH